MTLGPVILLAAAAWAFAAEYPQTWRPLDAAKAEALSGEFRGANHGDWRRSRPEAWWGLAEAGDPARQLFLTFDQFGFLKQVLLPASARHRFGDSMRPEAAAARAFILRNRRFFGVADGALPAAIDLRGGGPAGALLFPQARVGGYPVFELYREGGNPVQGRAAANGIVLRWGGDRVFYLTGHFYPRLAAPGKALPFEEAKGLLSGKTFTYKGYEESARPSQGEAPPMLVHEPFSRTFAFSAGDLARLRLTQTGVLPVELDSGGAPLGQPDLISDATPSPEDRRLQFRLVHVAVGSDGGTAYQVLIDAVGGGLLLPSGPAWRTGPAPRTSEP